MRNEKVVEPSQQSKIGALDSLSGAHNITEAITESKDHVYRPGQVN
jgi:hypothetical protein